jgi:hypothetical protein
VTVCCGHGGRRGICGRRDAVVVVGGVAEEVYAAGGLVLLRCSVNAGKYEVCILLNDVFDLFVLQLSLTVILTPV